MCNFWSCILTREGEVLWSKDTDSHEELVNRHDLNDRKLKDRDFVRIEINPVDATSKDRGDWRYKVDEEGTLPVWYESNTRHWERVIWDTWGEAMQQTLWAAPWFDRLCDLVERLKTLRPGEAKVSRSTVKAALEEYRKRLTAQDKQHREWAISEVKFYTASEWDSVWASVWDSVRDSVLDSVRASVWDSVWASVLDSVRASVVCDEHANYGIPLIDCLEAGCVLYGVSDDGVAHVVMVGKDGGQ